MKAVIVEIRDKTAAVLSDDGCIVRIKNNNYEIGQEVDFNMKFRFNLKKVAVIAAAACFLFVFGGSAIAYYTPATYVSLDVNPSIEYSLNIFDRVLSVKGVNDDGSKIIDEIKLDNLGNKTIDEAIALTVDKIAKAGYLEDDKSGIEITTSAKDLKKASELAQNLENVANETCEQNNCKAEVNAEAVGAERVEKAKELGVTPGKLNLVEKLVESSEDPKSIDVSEWLNKSVKDIKAKTNENKELSKEQQKNEGEDTEQNEETNEGSETSGNTSVNNDNAGKNKSDTGKDKSENKIKGSAAGKDTETVSGSEVSESEAEDADDNDTDTETDKVKSEDSGKGNLNKNQAGTDSTSKDKGKSVKQVKADTTVKANTDTQTEVTINTDSEVSGLNTVDGSANAGTSTGKTNKGNSSSGKSGSSSSKNGKK